MTRCPDHPDDITQRQQLPRQLTQLRLQLGVPVEDLADAAGTTPDAIRLFERNGTNAYLHIAQRYVRGLGHRLNIWPTLPVTLPTHPHTANLLAMAAGADDPDQADTYQRAAAMHHAVTYRLWSGVSARDLGQRLGVSRRSGNIGNVENEYGKPMIRTWQWYLRGLGGRLPLTLEPVNPDPHRIEGDTP